MPGTANLEIDLRLRADGNYAVEFRFQPPGSDAEVRLLRDRAGLVLAADFKKLVAFEQNSKAYGTALGQALFRDPSVAAAFAQARSVAHSQDAALRFRLLIDPGESMLNLIRWECLRDLDGDAVCTSERVLFSRYLSSRDWSPAAPRAQAGMKALVVISNPSNLDRYTLGGEPLATVDSADEWERAQAALAHTEITRLPAATLNNIAESLRSGFDILYLVCHGAMQKDAPHLWLENDQGLADVVAGGSFVDRFRELPARPHLVVLASCQSAGTGAMRSRSSGSLNALGPQLADAGVPAVVAMQGNLSFETEAQFMPAFFQELARDGQIDRAMSAARGAVRSRPDYWTPVLFMRLLSGRLWIADEPDDSAVEITGNPYRGLEAFDVADQDFFYGREALLDSLLDGFRPRAGAGENRFLALIGPSGSGKSSLARAGLLGGIRHGALTGSAEWPIAVMRPAGDPLENLALALAQAGCGEKTPAALGGAVKELRDNQRALHLIVRLHLGDAASRRLVLLVDQFEEVFTQCHDQEVRQAFIGNLMTAMESGGTTLVVLTLRADLYGECAAYPALAAALSKRQMLVGPMQEDELRRAIEQPAVKVGAEFEPGLVDALVDEVRGQPGALPLLQDTLLELWQRRKGRRLTHSAYQEIGKVTGALERRAEEVWAQFGEAQQLAARKVFLRLVQTTGRQATRQRARMIELLPADGDGAMVEQVVATLAGPRVRLLTLEAEEVEGTSAAGQSVDIVHEALIRHWPRLQGWLNEDSEFQLWRKRLNIALEEWERTDRHPDGLLRGALLEEARRWLEARPGDLNRDERDFIKTGVNLEKLRQQEELAQQQALEEEQRRRLQAETERAEMQSRSASRLRKLATLLAVLFAAAVCAAGLAIYQKVVADRERAKSASLALAGISAIGDNPDLRVMLALNAVASWDTRDAEEALYSAVQALRGPRYFTDRQNYTVGQMAFSPDTNTLATANNDGTVAFWNAQDGTRLGATVKLGSDAVSVAFRKDGALGVGTAAGAVQIIDTSGKQVAPEMHLSAKEIRSLAFNPDGMRLAAGDQDSGAFLWSFPSGPARALAGHSAGPVGAIAFTPMDGKLVAAVSVDGTAVGWDAGTGQQSFTLAAPGLSPLLSMAISPSGKIAAIGDSSGSISLWELPSGHPLGTAHHSDSKKVLGLAFSGDGQTLASASQDGTIKFWDVGNGTTVHERLTTPCGKGPPSDGCSAMALMTDGHSLAVAGQNGEIRLFETSFATLFSQAVTWVDPATINADDCKKYLQSHCEAPRSYTPAK